MSVPVLEAKTLVAIRLPGPNLEHQRGPGTRDIYRRDDKAVSLTYRYEGTVLR